MIQSKFFQDFGYTAHVISYLDKKQILALIKPDGTFIDADLAITTTKHKDALAKTAIQTPEFLNALLILLRTNDNEFTHNKNQYLSELIEIAATNLYEICSSWDSLWGKSLSRAMALPINAEIRYMSSEYYRKIIPVLIDSNKNDFEDINIKKERLLISASYIIEFLNNINDIVCYDVKKLIFTLPVRNMDIRLLKLICDRLHGLPTQDHKNKFLIKAVYFRNIEAVDYLVSRGAEINQPQEFSLEYPAGMIVPTNADYKKSGIDAPDKLVPLSIGCDIEMLKELVRLGADVTIENEMGLNILDRLFFPYESHYKTNRDKDKSYPRGEGVVGYMTSEYDKYIEPTFKAIRYLCTLPGQPVKIRSMKTYECTPVLMLAVIYYPGMTRFLNDIIEEHSDWISNISQFIFEKGILLDFLKAGLNCDARYIIYQKERPSLYCQYGNDKIIKYLFNISKLYMLFSYCDDFGDKRIGKLNNVYKWLKESPKWSTVSANLKEIIKIYIGDMEFNSIVDCNKKQYENIFLFSNMGTLGKIIYKFRELVDFSQYVNFAPIYKIMQIFTLKSKL